MRMEHRLHVSQMGMNATGKVMWREGGAFLRPTPKPGFLLLRPHPPTPAFENGGLCPSPHSSSQLSRGLSLPEVPLPAALGPRGQSLAFSRQIPGLASRGTQEAQLLAECPLGLLNGKEICPPPGPSSLMERRPTRRHIGSDRGKLMWRLPDVFCAPVLAGSL